VDQWKQAPRSGSLSDSDREQYPASNDGALSSSGEDWEEISEDSASLSVISATSGTDIPRIEAIRRLRRRGSAPELGHFPDWEETQIQAERRQRPIEGERLDFFDYDAATPDRPSRLRDERLSLGGFGISTRFEHTPNGPTGKSCYVLQL
jgi:hypothetical protein